MLDMVKETAAAEPIVFLNKAPKDQLLDSTPLVPVRSLALKLHSTLKTALSNSLVDPNLVPNR